MSETRQVVEHLQNLVRTCKDGEDGYHQAASLVEDPALSGIFQNLGQQRRTMRTQLEDALAVIGESGPESGSIAAGVHRAWFQAKAAVNGQDESAVVEECQRGDRLALKAYEKALEELTPSIAQATLIQTHHQQIQQSLTELQEQLDRLAVTSQR